MGRIVAIVGIGLAFVAFTATLVMAQADIPAIVEKSQGDVRYASGGVGVEVLGVHGREEESCQGSRRGRRS